MANCSDRSPSQFQWKDLLQIAAEANLDSDAYAVCRIMETKGSTPQKPGAAMLVRADGTQHGTIGGGCVEAEVSTRARMAVANRRPEVAVFTLDGDYGWDDGLICGGRMKIAIEPILDRDVQQFYQSYARHILAGRGATEVIEWQNANHPVYALFDEDNNLVTSLRCDRETAQSRYSDALRPLRERPQPYTVGATSHIPVYPRCRLVIVGAGHVGQAVAQLAADLDFEVWVVDDRSEFACRDKFPRAQQFLVGPLEWALPKLNLDASSYCLIVTRGHKQDEKALFHVIQQDAHYLGLIGSRRKINLIFEDLLEEGISAERLAEVHAPVGIDIGSQSVAEIAISIAAEIVAFRNRNGQVPGRPDPVRVIANG